MQPLVGSKGEALGRDQDPKAPFVSPAPEYPYLFKVDNLFDAHFNWLTDPFVWQGRNPVREILLTLKRSF
ncbi:MAG: hypothetical protein HQL98_10215 [Magnetococcales bacterium]|nr:hypothetical protein [Magnetococcales bacterium]